MPESFPSLPSLTTLTDTITGAASRVGKSATESLAAGGAAALDTLKTARTSDHVISIFTKTMISFAAGASATALSQAVKDDTHESLHDLLKKVERFLEVGKGDPKNGIPPSLTNQQISTAQRWVADARLALTGYLKNQQSEVMKLQSLTTVLVQPPPAPIYVNKKGRPQQQPQQQPLVVVKEAPTWGEVLQAPQQIAAIGTPDPATLAKADPKLFRLIEALRAVCNFPNAVQKAPEGLSQRIDNEPLFANAEFASNIKGFAGALIKNLKTVDGKKTEKKDLLLLSGPGTAKTTSLVVMCKWCNYPYVKISGKDFCAKFEETTPDGRRQRKATSPRQAFHVFLDMVRDAIRNHFVVANQKVVAGLIILDDFHFAFDPPPRNVKDAYGGPFYMDPESAQMFVDFTKQIGDPTEDSFLSETLAEKDGNLEALEFPLNTGRVILAMTFNRLPACLNLDNMEAAIADRFYDMKAGYATAEERQAFGEIYTKLILKSTIDDHYSDDQLKVTDDMSDEQKEKIRSIVAQMKLAGIQSLTELASELDRHSLAAAIEEVVKFDIGQFQQKNCKIGHRGLMFMLNLWDGIIKSRLPPLPLKASADLFDLGNFLVGKETIPAYVTDMDTATADLERKRKLKEEVSRLRTTIAQSKIGARAKKTILDKLNEIIEKDEKQDIDMQNAILQDACFMHAWHLSVVDFSQDPYGRKKIGDRVMETFTEQKNDSAQFARTLGVARNIFCRILANVNDAYVTSPEFFNKVLNVNFGTQRMRARESIDKLAICLGHLPVCYFSDTSDIIFESDFAVGAFETPPPKNIKISLREPDITADAVKGDLTKLTPTKITQKSLGSKFFVYFEYCSDIYLIKPEALTAYAGSQVCYIENNAEILKLERGTKSDIAAALEAHLSRPNVVEAYLSRAIKNNMAQGIDAISNSPAKAIIAVELSQEVMEKITIWAKGESPNADALTYFQRYISKQLRSTALEYGSYTLDLRSLTVALIWGENVTQTDKDSNCTVDWLMSPLHVYGRGPAARQVLSERLMAAAREMAKEDALIEAGIQDESGSVGRSVVESVQRLALDDGEKAAFESLVAFDLTVAESAMKIGYTLTLRSLGEAIASIVQHAISRIENPTFDQSAEELVIGWPSAYHEDLKVIEQAEKRNADASEAEAKRAKLAEVQIVEKPASEKLVDNEREMLLLQIELLKLKQAQASSTNTTPTTLVIDETKSVGAGGGGTAPERLDQATTGPR